MYDPTEEGVRPAEEPADTALLRIPPLLLAGVDEDEQELHLVRGID